MSFWINYHHLFYFRTIAEEGSVSAAAKKLRLGQPTLSAQLKQFEESLGIQLFERHHKKLILTEQGKVALDYARNIFKLGGEMVEVLQDRLVESRIHVEIGALDSIPKQIILALAKAAYSAGKCNISLKEGKSDEMIRELLAHRIDLFVTNFIPTTGELQGLTRRSVIKRPVSLFGSAKFKSLRKGFPESIAGAPMILPTHDSKLRHDVEHWLRVNNLNVDIVAETQDISLKQLMAEAGMGLVPAASHNVADQIDSGTLIEIGSLPGIQDELFLVSAQRRIANPIAAELMKTFSL